LYTTLIKKKIEKKSHFVDSLAKQCAKNSQASDFFFVIFI